MDFNIIGLIKAAIINGTPLLYGTSGEILTEKSGNLNLGVEGLMFMGGAFGLMGAFVYGNAAGDNASGAVAIAIALICSFGIGCIGSLIFSFLTITLRANQNVTGLALTIFGTGVGQFVGELMRIKVGGNVTISNALKAAFADPILPKALQNIPVIGQVLFSYNLFVYLGIIMALVMAWFMKKTRKGLFLSAVGESPATADAAGINVTKYRYLATVIGGGISAVGGMVYTMNTINTNVIKSLGKSNVFFIIQLVKRLYTYSITVKKKKAGATELRLFYVSRVFPVGLPPVRPGPGGSRGTPPRCC